MSKSSTNELRSLSAIPRCPPVNRQNLFPIVCDTNAKGPESSDIQDDFKCKLNDIYLATCELKAGAKYNNPAGINVIITIFNFGQKYREHCETLLKLPDIQVINHKVTRGLNENSGWILEFLLHFPADYFDGLQEPNEVCQLALGVEYMLSIWTFDQDTTVAKYKDTLIKRIDERMSMWIDIEENHAALNDIDTAKHFLVFKQLNEYYINYFD